MRIVIQDVGGFLGHQSLEYAVDRFEKGGAASEVEAQVNDLPVADTIQGGTFAVLFQPAQEAARLCQTKSVNALLDVSDAKKIRAFMGFALRPSTHRHSRLASERMASWTSLIS